MTSLREKQSAFVFLVAKLIEYAYANGYELTFGEAQRSHEEALRLWHLGAGILDSLHIIRLAIDLNLFKNGIYLTKTEEYEPLGVFWESLSTADYKCCWGGRFPSPKQDGNHFSIEHEGVK